MTTIGIACAASVMGVLLGFLILAVEMFAARRRVWKGTMAKTFRIPDGAEFGGPQGQRYRAFVPRWYQLHRHLWWLTTGWRMGAVVQMTGPARRQLSVRVLVVAEAPERYREPPSKTGGGPRAFTW